MFDDIVGGITAAISPSAIASTIGGGASSLLGPLASTAMQFGSGLINARAQSQQNDRAEANSWEAQRIQHEREDTAIQRRSADMTAAGFNPILAAGDGASSSSASFGTSAAPQIVAPDIMPALNFSEMAKNNAVNRQLTQTQTAKELATIQNINADTRLKNETIPGGLIQEGFRQTRDTLKSGWKTLTQPGSSMSPPEKKKYLNPNYKMTPKQQKQWQQFKQR